MLKRDTGFSIPRVLILLALLLGNSLGGGLSTTKGETGAALAAPQQPAAATDTITLSVVSARTEADAFDGAGVTKGDPVTEYEFLINVDNTGDPNDDSPDCDPFLADEVTRNPNYPGDCELPSIRTTPGWAPIYFQGDETDLNDATTLTLPPGDYLISVMADGYRMDGEHFTIPMEETSPGAAEIEVGLQPEPLPPATLVIKVFADISLTNGQFDAPGEYGVEGFRASINDIAGEITTDLFGNPLCTQYDPAGNPIPGTGTPDCLYSDANGMITIPNIGPMRYDVLVFPPEGEQDQWIQTTTLEGSHGWDTWLQEAGTGLDNEFLIAAEPFPWTIFGFVPSECRLGDAGDECPGNDDLAEGTGSIEGVIMGAATYVPAEGGLPYIGDTFGGFMGTKLQRPINRPWLSLNSLQDGDTAVWIGQGNADGSFSIPNVPAGDYFLTYWDEKQHYILDFVQVTVEDGQVSDVGIRMLTGWFTEISGHVFNDTNENGRRDPGEPGISDYVVVLRDRDNSEIDRMSIAALSDANGFYELEKGYPMGWWMVLEAYSDLYHTTGVTYQTLNMKEEKTLLGNIVDIGLLPVLGQPVRLDWGVKPYGPDENGGIAGSVFYDTVRAEDEARYAGAEPWQPGIPGLTLNLYEAQIDAYGQPVRAPDGSYAKGELLAQTTTETFERPKGCQALDVNGDPVDFPPLPDPADNKPCLEGPMTGTQIGDGQNNLDGNWGFDTVCYGVGSYYDTDLEGCVGGGTPEPLPVGKYLVEIEIPHDASGNPMFTVTREEDVNMFDGDEFEPAIPPVPCAGPLHIVDVKDAGTDNYPSRPWAEDPSIILPASTPVENPTYAAEFGAGFGRFEGEAMPLCDVKYVELTNGKAVAPLFTLFTDVPIPGKWRGYIIDNLNVSVDPYTLFFGEMAGVPNVPIGLYDFSGRLVHTAHSDFNGVYEVLMPSVETVNAPSPSGMLAAVYYQYGNDPGPLDNPNLDYNPQYRSIGTSFEIYPGVIIPADLAPTQNGAAIWSPGAQYDRLALCNLPDTDPQLYAVSQPYATDTSAITIDGIGFGATQGTILLGNAAADIASWSDRQIAFSVPAGTAAGAYQLTVVTADGKTTVTGLTFHVLGTGYNPTVYEVGPGRAYDPADHDPTAGEAGPIQAAIDAAWAAGGDSLVVVYPGQPVPMVNPQGRYVENPVLYAPVKLQGVGPGGTYTDTAAIPGSIIDGRGVGGDSAYDLWWRETFVPEIWNNRGGWDRGLVDGDGNPRLYEGAVVTVFGEAGEFGSGFPASIDGFIIQGGDQQGFPNNVQQVGGAPIPGVPANVVVQGGGIFVDGYGSNLEVTNNLIQSNGGAYGGAIRLGTPHITGTLKSNHNENVTIRHNRILANGGTNLAGAIALFNGADGYEIAYNDLCGNSSIEYGGGISHYGYSPNGRIHHNRIYFNSSYDEGGGVMIAGELPADPSVLSEGAGPVDIFNNLIQSNMANDDGGGLRFLMAGDFEYSVYNNMIVNNVSTHEGGGASLNDAPNVRLFNNTMMKNLTTATAMTSNGQPRPAGLSTSPNSSLLQATLPAGAPTFSNPMLFNNVWWDNRAGSWDGDSVSGIGLEGDPGGINYWDLGVTDGSADLAPMYSLMQTDWGATPHVTNLVGQDPLAVDAYTTTLRIFPWRGNANFVGANIVANDLPIDLTGDYHLTASSPAIDAGTDAVGGINAPLGDFDDETRFWGFGFDMGADEFGAYATSPGCFDFVEPAGVDVADVQFIASHWRWPAGPPYDCDGDGIITVIDLMCVVAQWGQACP
jgi:hypothetical protein